MSTLETATETYIPRKVWTREEAHCLAEIGFPNASRLELVNGEIIDHMGKKRPHVLWHNLVRQWLELVFGGEFVQSEDPIDVAPGDLPTSEPQPDLIVTTKPIRAFSENPKPEELRLVVEISDTTVQFDLNVKGKLYARAGIVEYWVINVPEKKLIVLREPRDGKYTRIATHASHEEIAPLGIEVRICLDKL